MDVNPINLAFLGDAIFTLATRERLLRTRHGEKPNTMHRLASKYNCATRQAQFFDMLYDKLTDNERDIANKARNAKTNTVPKSCTLCDYKKATALEAILGYHMMTANEARLAFLLEPILAEVV